MKERLKAILPKIGFPLFYLLCLVVFARWTFPWEKLRDRIVATANERAGAGRAGDQREIKIDLKLGPSALASASSAKGVHIFGPPTEPGKPPTELTIDAARGASRSSALLFGGHDLGFSVEGFRRQRLTVRYFEARRPEAKDRGDHVRLRERLGQVQTDLRTPSACLSKGSSAVRSRSRFPMVSRRWRRARVSIEASRTSPSETGRRSSRASSGPTEAHHRYPDGRGRRERRCAQDHQAWRERQRPRAPGRWGASRSEIR